jgi:hypothetical protein
VLEAIALRRQIAVLERSRTRRLCLCRCDRLLWILLSRWWPQWRDSLMIRSGQDRLALAPKRRGQRFGGIDQVVAGEVGV